MEYTNKYKKYLSPFGRDVLEFMINQWKADHLCCSNTNNAQHQRHHVVAAAAVPKRAPQRKMINFTAEESTLDVRSPTVALAVLKENTIADPDCLGLPNPMTTTDQNHDFDCKKMNIYPENNKFCDETNRLLPLLPVKVPTLGQLINFKGVHTLIKENSAENIFNNTLQLKDDAIPQDVMLTQDLVKVVDDKNLHDNKSSGHVDWDDMFDLGTLDPLAAIMKHAQINEMPETKLIFDKKNPDKLKEDKVKRKVIKIISDENITIDKLKKPKKRNNNAALQENSKPLSKKVKKLSLAEKGENLRKESYTKTVQKWLNDVTANNDSTSNKQIDTTKINKPILPVAKLEVCKPKKDKNEKKRVQSKLANKDGVMKFKKPDKSKVVAESDDIPIEINTSNEDVVKESNTQFSTSKTKGKPKFVAPIKSQIPVKEITFNIVALDENGVAQNATEKTLDITLMLLYSNGFCQLNSQHTDDDLIPTGILIRDDNNEFYHVKESNSNVLRHQVLQILKRRVVCFDAKKILIYLRNCWGIQCDDVNIVDTKIGVSLLDPDRTIDTFKDLQSAVSFVPEFKIATECSLQKSAWYLTLLQQVADKVQALLIEESLWNVFLDIEMNLLPIIADMEYRGVQVDLEKLKSMESILLEKLKSVEQDCYKAAGKSFQINSTLQVRNILYDELNLDTKSNVRIRETITTGAKSTSECMLRSLADVHPLPKLILEYRHLHKAHATFLTGIAQFVKDDVVRPVWDQMAAVTGRIASNNPNLQAIPKAPFSLVMFPDENSDTQVLNFRSVYVSRPGFTLVAADFQHIECRVFAYAAADTSLVEILQSGDDLFRVLAAKWLKKSECAVSAENRERTKRIVYASLYGAGARKLMDILQISYEQTLSIISSFNRTFPSLKGFGRAVVSQCEASGGRLATLSGRVRRFAHIASCDHTLKAQAERQAVNYIVQGSAADICKKAMILTQRRLRDLPQAEARLLLSIHDELVWEVRDQWLDEAAACIKTAMEGSGAACGLCTELPVALAAGRSWGALLPYPTP